MIVNVIATKPIGNYPFFKRKIFSVLNKEGLELYDVDLIVNYNLKKVANQLKKNTGIKINVKGKVQKNANILIILCHHKADLKINFKGKIYKFSFNEKEFIFV